MPSWMTQSAGALVAPTGAASTVFSGKQRRVEAVHDKLVTLKAEVEHLNVT